MIVKWQKRKSGRTFARFFLFHMVDVQEIIGKGRAKGFKVSFQTRDGALMDFAPVA